MLLPLQAQWEPLHLPIAARSIQCRQRDSMTSLFTLHLNSLPFPGKGRSDFAWLVADKTQDSIAPILLGRLSIVDGKARLSYQDKRHTDLLITYSRLLVTEQDSAPAPNIPPIDPKTWRYQANIPDAPTPGDEKGYSLLSHMRHLLAQDSTLSQIGLHGGLDIWLYRNIGKILEWSSAARDDWGGHDVDLTRRQVDRIVEYLDGQVYAFRDLPPGTPWLVDSHAGRPGLIDFDTAADEQGPPSYISHVKLHLMGMVNAPGHTAAQHNSPSYRQYVDNHRKTVTAHTQRCRPTRSAERCSVQAAACARPAR